MASEEPIEPVMDEQVAPVAAEEALKSPVQERTDEKMEDDSAPAPTADEATDAAENPAVESAAQPEEVSTVAEKPEGDFSEEKPVEVQEARAPAPDADMEEPAHEDPKDMDSPEGYEAGQYEYGRNSRSTYRGSGRGAGDGGDRDRPAPLSRSPTRPGCSLFFGNLPFSVRWQGLKDFAREAGRVNFAEVTTGPDGRSRGFGIVEYAHPHDARRAIDMLNDAELEGRRIFVRFDRDTNGGDERDSYGRGDTDRSPPPSRYGGNDYDLDDQHSRRRERSSERYSSRRRRESSYDRYEPSRRRDRSIEPRDEDRYGSSRRSRPSDSDRYSSRREASTRYEPRASRVDDSSADLNCQVFVNNLPYSVRGAELEDLFSDAGRVVKATIMETRDRGRSTGRGVVVFENPEDAQRAIQKFDGFEMDGRRLEVREDRGYTNRTRDPRNSRESRDSRPNPRARSPPPPRVKEFTTKSNAIPVAPRFGTESPAATPPISGDVVMPGADDLNGGWF